MSSPTRGGSTERAGRWRSWRRRLGTLLKTADCSSYMLKRREVEAVCEPGRRLDIFAVESLLGRLSDLKRLVRYCLWNALFRHDLSQGADGT